MMATATATEQPVEQAAAVLSKRALKKAKKLTAEETESEQQHIAASVDHPYLSFLHKRIRLYKKKLEKIKALQADDGKKLNDQQQELVASRGLVEKMIVEFESLRSQFIEVFVAEQKSKLVDASKPEETTTKTKPQEVETSKEETVSAPSAEPQPTPVDGIEYVADLLRTLHAVTLHQALGKEVPLVLDYFSKVLLGTTRLPAEVPFEENLAESLAEAGRYLTRSDQIVAQTFTYRDLRVMVETLGVGEEKVDGVDDQPESKADAQPQSNVDESAVEEINFFTDSVLDGDAKIVVAPPSPPVSAVPAPPKSAWTNPSNGPPTDTQPPTDNKASATDDKPRRRPTTRKPPTSSNNSNEKTVDAATPATATAAGKPRRARAPRSSSNDENSAATHNVKRTSSSGSKAGDDRRPRQPRKQPQDKPVAAVATA